MRLPRAPAEFRGYTCGDVGGRFFACPVKYCTGTSPTRHTWYVFYLSICWACVSCDHDLEHDDNMGRSSYSWGSDSGRGGSLIRHFFLTGVTPSSVVFFLLGVIFSSLGLILHIVRRYFFLFDITSSYSTLLLPLRRYFFLLGITYSFSALFLPVRHSFTLVGMASFF